MASHPIPEMPSQQSSSAASGETPITTGGAAARRGDHSHIAGWGADLDRKNRPAYPKERTPPRLEGLHWSRPADQPLRMKVYHSTERPDMTPIFGTSTPPSWLSGKMRAWAYRLAENDVRHWLLLLLADRINMVEGLLQDLGRGRVPNIFSEMGIKAEWKYNRIGLLKKTLLVSVLAVGAYRLFGTRSRERNAGRTHADMELHEHRPPGFYSGLGSATRQERADLVRNALIATAVVGTAIYLLGYRRRR